MLKNTALTGVLTALLSTWTPAPVAADDKAALGKADITLRKAKQEKLYVLRYRVRTPAYALSDVWVRLDLKTTSQRAPQATPPEIGCLLAINDEQQPGYEYAQYRDGALYLYFERLKPATNVQFFIGWDFPGQPRIAAYEAALRFDEGLPARTAAAKSA